MKKRGKTVIKKNILILISIICLILFLIILIDILTTKQITKLDYLIYKAILNIQTPIITPFFIVITFFGNTIPLIILTIIFSAFLLIKRKYFHLTFLILSMCLGTISELSIKALIHRLRPENSLIEITRFSFPSGHATMTTIFLTIFLYSTIKNIKSKKVKTALVITTILIIFLISLSRIYLGVHWFSDVLGGIILGILINSFILFLIKRYKK
jgi:undecaprenyl-diphosphatase